MEGRACIRGMRVTVGMFVAQIGVGRTIIDAVHRSHLGDPDPRAPDSLLASYALANGLVVLTQDLDFGA